MISIGCTHIGCVLLGACVCLCSFVHAQYNTNEINTTTILPRSTMAKRRPVLPSKRTCCSVLRIYKRKKIPVHLKCVSELLEGIFAVLTTVKQTCQLKIPVIDFCKIHQGFDLSAERRLCQVESKLKATFSNLFSIFIESPLYIFFSSSRSVEETNSHLLLRLYTMRIQKNRATR